MVSKTAGGPYRSAAPRAAVRRPLEPEDEMTLLLEAAQRPRGLQAWVLGACTIVGLTLLVSALFVPAALLGALYFLAPPITAAAAWIEHRRRIARLRKEGYDVEEATLELRPAVDGRVRIDVRVDDASVEEHDHAADGDDRAAQAVARW